MNPMFWTWLAIAVIMAVVEAATPTLVTIWFMFGAVTALIAAWLGGSVAVQLILFVVVSMILLIATRPLAKRLLDKTDKNGTNADRIINETGIVTEEIDNIKNQGEVTVLGQVWSAKSESGNIIPQGQMVTVTGISGVKAVVKEV